MSAHDNQELGPYVLGVMEADEAAALAAHVRTCPACADEVARIEETINLLALGVSREEPPPSLKERVIEAARATAVEAAVPSSVAPEHRVLARTREQSSLWPGRPLALGLLAAAAAVLLLAGVLLGRSTYHPMTSALARYEQLTGRAAIEGQTVRPFVPARGFHGAAALAIAVSGRSTLIIGPTRAPSPGDVYELWFLNSLASARTAGVFRAQPSGASVLSIPRSAGGYKLAAITQEPGPSGTTKPTASPLMATRL